MGLAEYDEAAFMRELGLDALDLRLLDYWSPLFCHKTCKDGHEYLMDGMIKSEKDLA